jgi:uncharacterized protein (DUF2336 family)
VDEAGWTSLVERVQTRARAAHLRLPLMITDLFLPDDARLTDQQRALLGNLLGNLIRAVEMELRWRLVRRLGEMGLSPPALAADLINPDFDMALPRLERSQLLRDTGLFEVLRARMQEHMLGLAADKSGHRMSVERWVQASESHIGRRAMEYLVAESRRMDRTGEPLVPPAELPDAVAQRLTWRVAAGLQLALEQRAALPALVVQSALDWSARQELALADPSAGLAARARGLCARLREQDEISDAWLLHVLQEGRAHLFAAGLAERAQAPARAVWHMVFEPDFEAFILLCRAAGVGRTATRDMLAQLQAAAQPTQASPLPLDEMRLLNLFDDVSAEQSTAIIAAWRIDPAFTEALAQLSDQPFG